MNNDRRKQLRKAVEILDQMEKMFAQVIEITETVRSDEEDALANMPESLQEGEQGQKMQAAIDRLDDGITMEDAFAECRNAIEEAMA